MTIYQQPVEVNNLMRFFDESINNYQCQIISEDELKAYFKIIKHLSTPFLQEFEKTYKWINSNV